MTDALLPPYNLYSEAYAERAVTHTGSLAGPLGIKLS
jgi:hypothetical protein